MEIERKYKINKIPDNLNVLSEKRIVQGYIASANDGSEVRVRNVSEECYLTVKSGRGMVRGETEVAISYALFSALWPLTLGKRIEKKRLLVSEGNYKIEIDVFSGRLQGLVIAEIEFPSVKDALSFAPPNWFSLEITENEEYRNQNLAH